MDAANRSLAVGREKATIGVARRVVTGTQLYVCPACIVLTIYNQSCIEKTRNNYCKLASYNT